MKRRTGPSGKWHVEAPGASMPAEPLAEEDAERLFSVPPSEG
jgi:hypothetical protein